MSASAVRLRGRPGDRDHQACRAPVERAPAAPVDLQGVGHWLPAEVRRRCPRAEPSPQWRVVKRCGASGSSGRQTSAGPASGWSTHSKGAGAPAVSFRCSMSNIIGLGLDATDIPRIAATIERYGERFLRRVFTDGEIAYCMRRRKPAIHFAGRFAAKEAAMKALGTGHAEGPLARRRSHSPRRSSATPVSWRCRGTISALGAGSSLLTITHSGHLALARCFCWRAEQRELAFFVRSRRAWAWSATSCFQISCVASPYDRAFISNLSGITLISALAFAVKARPLRPADDQGACSHDHQDYAKRQGNPPGKLADAELHFTDGPLEGLKLIGFGIWERRIWQAEMSHSPPASTASTASAAASRSSGRSSTTTAQNRIRDLILDAFQEYEGNAAIAS